MKKTLVRIILVAGALLAMSATTAMADESVAVMSSLEHLAHTNDSIIAEYEEKAE